MARNRVKVKLNGRGMAELLKSDGVRQELRRRGEQVAAQARSTAPVASGAYQASIAVQDATTDRAVVRVKADVDYATAIEAGTGNLARALDAG